MRTIKVTSPLPSEACNKIITLFLITIRAKPKETSSPSFQKVNLLLDKLTFYVVIPVFVPNDHMYQSGKCNLNYIAFIMLFTSNKI